MNQICDSGVSAIASVSDIASLSETMSVTGGVDGAVCVVNFNDGFANRVQNDICQMDISQGRDFIALFVPSTGYYSFTQYSSESINPMNSINSMNIDDESVGATDGDDEFDEIDLLSDDDNKMDEEFDLSGLCEKMEELYEENTVKNTYDEDLYS